MKHKAEDYSVLFIISDQHKRSATGCYGHPLVRTPNIDRLAREGLLFASAYCQSPLCGPSRSSVMTGTHCHTCRGLTHTQPVPIRDVPTLGSVFRDAGYVTASIGKVHIRGEQPPEADADAVGGVRDLGFDHRELRYYTYEYRDYLEAVGPANVDRYNAYRKGAGVARRDVYNPANRPIEMEEPLMYDALVVQRCIRFMERHKGERFFLWAGLEKPHPEWYAPQEYHRLYDPARVALPQTLREGPPEIPKITREKLRIAERYSDEQVRGCLAAYYANVTYLDANVGRLLSALERLGLAERTMVIYTTDHGELLFEHGMCQKHCFYEPAVAVPLILANRRLFPAGAVREPIVSLIDLFPTLCELTGVDRPPGLEGQPILDVIDGGADPAGREAFAEFYSWGAPERMIRTPEWKYVYTHGDVPQLYDVKNDPLEQNNLAADAAHRELCRELERRVLAGWEMPEADLIRPRPT